MNWGYPVDIVLGYLLGSIPVGLVVGYIWLRRDVRELGSGVTGTTNVFRNAGKAAGLIVMAADIGKGVVPALIGRFVFDDDGVAAAGAAAAVVGHVWPVFAGLRGGRGVATAFGGVLGLMPLVALLFPVIAAVVLLVANRVSVMSIVTTAVSAGIIAVLAAMDVEPWAFAIYGLLAVAVVEFRHIPNMKRLVAGTEPRLWQQRGTRAPG